MSDIIDTLLLELDVVAERMDRNRLVIDGLLAEWDLLVGVDGCRVELVPFLGVGS